MILADTSVWIEYLRRGDAGWAAELDDLLARRELMVCGPVFAELLSGVPADRRNDFALRLRALPWADLGRDAWLQIGFVRGDLARAGHPTGLTDVAVAVSAARAGAQLWSADAAHERIAKALDGLSLRLRRR